MEINLNMPSKNLVTSPTSHVVSCVMQDGLNVRMSDHRICIGTVFGLCVCGNDG